MAEKENNNWWRPAVLVFSEISTWIAFPVIFALFAGKALDDRFHTKPWIFIAFTCFGFLISTYGIIKTVKKFTANIKKEDSSAKIENKNK